MILKIDGEIKTDFKGFSKIAELINHNPVNYSDTNIYVDMQNSRFIDANMCAPIGATICYVQNLTKSRANIYPPQDLRVKGILERNHFFDEFGGQARIDTWKSTIPYQHFSVSEGRRFAEYIFSGFMRPEMPPMTNALRARFLQNLAEIFSNAVTHSQTELGIFTCGQFFPTRKHLDFCIVDLGMSIPVNIMKNKGFAFANDADAIDWAMRDRNTAKTGTIPGGLGLKLLFQFIELNGGRIFIVSRRGYWEYSDKKILAGGFDKPFPGTIVNVEINTDDKKSYALTEEIDPNDVF